jgi:hypothetical protein
MIFFKKKPKYLVFDNKTNRLLIKINEIAYIRTTEFNNDYFISISLINGTSLDFNNCFSKEGRDKTYEKIKNILINELETF